MRLPTPSRSPVRLLAAAVAAAAVVLGVLVLAPSRASASPNQVAILGDDGHVLADPQGTLATLKSLGVGVVRLTVHWNAVAPKPKSLAAPTGFAADAGNPTAYSSTSWAPYDAVVSDAAADGIAVDMLISGDAPLWARRPGVPAKERYRASWSPSAPAYGQFVKAVALRYPTVHFWEIWNEENWGPSLAPQQVGHTLVSAGTYRSMLSAAWTSLQATGHGHDTIVDGSLSPRGRPNPGAQLTSRPLDFLRALFCVSSTYKPLTGKTARAAGCPTGSGSAFRAANPALFNATGVGIHPYPYNLPPTEADSKDPGFVEFSEIPRLVSALNRLTGAYGSHTRLAVYNTEYGYETNPPNASKFFGHQHFVSPSTAASYINWAEYLSWREPQLASMDQYLLYDPNPASKTQYGKGGFATGLLFYSGKQKPGYAAYRMPLFLPLTTGRRGQSLEVWGCVRPAHTVPGLQSVQIQFQSGSKSSWRTLSTVAIHSVGGYFDVHVPFPSSGSVRLEWQYPQGATIYSRTVGIKLR